MSVILRFISWWFGLYTCREGKESRKKRGSRGDPWRNENKKREEKRARVMRTCNESMEITHNGNIQDEGVPPNIPSSEYHTGNIGVGILLPSLCRRRRTHNTYVASARKRRCPQDLTASFVHIQKGNRWIFNDHCAWTQ